MAESDSSTHLDSILHLLESAGFHYPRETDNSPFHVLSAGISWCIVSLDPTCGLVDVASLQTLNEIEVAERFEEALSLMGCPHPLRPLQILNFDYNSVVPVVQWLVNRVKKTAESNDKVFSSTPSIGDGERTLQLHEEELNIVGTSIKKLSANLDEQNKKKCSVMKDLQDLRDRISKEGAETKVQKLASLLKSLKAVKRQESEFQSYCKSERSGLEADILNLEEKKANVSDIQSLSDSLNESLSESLEQLNSAKRELAGRLRVILSLKRKLDEFPSQSELIQYERRFSELNIHIQEKLRQTRKYYATYNTLLDIKELMLKETSLLNSISSQFQDAITSPSGRVKLMDSMEGIVKGSEQKLKKVQLGLQEEQKACDALKQRYTAAMMEQRRCYSLLKAFQEECTKNERLRSQSSAQK